MLRKVDLNYLETESQVCMFLLLWAHLHHLYFSYQTLKNVPKSKWNCNTKFRCSGSCSLRDIKDFPLSIINDNVCRSCPLFTTFCRLFTTVPFIYHLVYYLPLFVHYLPLCHLFTTLSIIYHQVVQYHHRVQYLQLVVHYVPLLTPGDLARTKRNSLYIYKKVRVSLTATLFHISLILVQKNPLQIPVGAV